MLRQEETERVFDIVRRVRVNITGHCSTHINEGILFVACHPCLHAHRMSSGFEPQITPLLLGIKDMCAYLFLSFFFIKLDEG